MMKARRPLAGATSIKTKSGFVRAGVYFCSGITFAVLIYMLVYIFVKGVPYLLPTEKGLKFLRPEKKSQIFEKKIS